MGAAGARTARQSSVRQTLQGLRDLDGLQRLFWQQLHYAPAHRPVRWDRWPARARQALAEEPLLFACGGEAHRFHLLYGRLAGEALPTGLERLLVRRLIPRHPHALIVFANSARRHWHFLSPERTDRGGVGGRIRRLTVALGDRLRIAAERLEMLDLEPTTGPDAPGRSTEVLRRRCDAAFAVETLQRAFLKTCASLRQRIAQGLSGTGRAGPESEESADRVLTGMILLCYLQKRGGLNQQPDYLHRRFLACRRTVGPAADYYATVLLPLFQSLSGSAGRAVVVDGARVRGWRWLGAWAGQEPDAPPWPGRLPIRHDTFQAIFDALLERFDFTLREPTPLDVEVAIDPDMLGRLLAGRISRREQDPHRARPRPSGSHDTPRALAHWMGREALREHLASVLAGGNATPLAPARRRIRRFLRQCLFGVDIQTIAVRVCRLRLGLALAAEYQPDPHKSCPAVLRAIPRPPDLSDHLVPGDSLLGPIRGTANLPPVFQCRAGFDIVLANPPYLSFGLRGQPRASRVWAEAIRRHYPGSAEYKISVYALFLARGLRWLRDGGVGCYLTPDSYLVGWRFSRIRRTLRDQTALRTFLMFEEDSWPAAVVGRPVVVTFQKKGRPGNMTALLAQNANRLPLALRAQHRYPQACFETVPHHRFRLFFGPLAERYVEALERGSVPLKTAAHITTGVRARSGRAGIVSRAPSGPTWKKGITSGRHVVPYRVCWAGDYLGIQPDLLFAGRWDASLVERPKILIRQTGDSLVAGLDDGHLYHLNSVHTLAPREASLSPPYVCAWLNSRLMNRCYHLVTLERGRPLAQTDIETLERLPYRVPTAQDVLAVERLVPAIERAGAQTELEASFARLYGLDEELRAYLDQDELYPVRARL